VKPVPGKSEAPENTRRGALRKDECPAKFMCCTTTTI
jgi:hypothetical protein